MSSHLVDYLEYYRELSEPGYAVMVTGAWGTGKTYQVRDAFKTRTCFNVYNRQDPLKSDDCIYVSLFGLGTREAIDAEVLSACDPASSYFRNFFKIFGTISRAASGIFAAGAAISLLSGPILRAAISRNSDRVLVLDDMERCNLSPEELLGTINYYVEHIGFKVVIICHDEKLSKKISKAKEKLVGQTLKISPNMDDAFDAFLSDTNSDKQRKIISKYKKDIIVTFNESGVESLRILSFIIRDISRMVGEIDDEYLNNIQAMKQIVTTVVALSALIYSGQLKKDDVKTKTNEQSRDNSFENMIDKLAEKSNRFSNVNLLGEVIPNQLQIEMFFYGNFNSQMIKDWVSTSYLFHRTDNSEAWWKVWHRYRLNDDVVVDAIKQMDQDFRERKYGTWSEIAHLLSLRLSICDEGLMVDGAIDDIYKNGINYIDDVYQAGRLEIASSLGSLSDWENIAAKGLQFSGVNSSNEQLSEQVKKTLKYLQEKRIAALRSIMPRIGIELVELLKKNSLKSIQEFRDKLTSTNSTPMPSAALPVLTTIDPDIFVQLLLLIDGSLWQEIDVVFRERTRLLNGRLMEERQWFQLIVEKIDHLTEQPSTDTVRKVRLKWLISEEIRSEVFRPLPEAH